MFLRAPDRTRRECLRYKAFLEGMGLSVGCRENVLRVERDTQSLIPIGLASICVETIYCFQRGVAAY